MFKNFWASADKQYLKIALPASLEGLFLILLGSVDLFMVSSMGAAAIASVNIFSQPRLVLLCVARSIASAVTLFAAHFFGRNYRKGASRILFQTLTWSIFFLLILHGIFFWQLENILTFMGADEEYILLAMEYGEIATIAVYISSITTILQAVQLGFGQTGIILRSNILGNLVNIFGNGLFIYGWLGFPVMGVRGAAVGTVMGVTISLGLTLYALHQENLLSKLPLKQILPTRLYWKKFLPVSLTLFSEQGCERVGMVLFTKIVASLGAVTFAVHSICMNLCDTYWNFAVGLGKANMVLAGQSVAQKNHAQWKNFHRIGVKWSLIFSTIVFMFLCFFREDLFKIFLHDSESVALAFPILIVYMLVNFPMAHAIIDSGVLRGSGETKIVALYSFICIMIVRPCMTALLIYPFEFGLLGAWIAMLFDQTSRAVVFSYFLQRLKKSFAVKTMS